MDFLGGILSVAFTRVIEWLAKKVRALLELARLKKLEEKKNEEIQIQNEKAQTKEERDAAADKVIDDFNRGGFH